MAMHLPRSPMRKTICFDKTGTLTTGDAQVTEFLAADTGDELFTLQVAASWPRLRIIRCRPHSCDSHASSSGLQSAAAHRRTAFVARTRNDGQIEGVHGTAFLGSRRWMELSGQHGGIPGADEGAVTLVAWEGRVRGRFTFSETLRPADAAVLSDLRQAGLHTVMLTGDQPRRAAALASELGMQFGAGLLPDDKLTVINALRKSGPVLMVGDGINDAPALGRRRCGHRSRQRDRHFAAFGRRSACSAMTCRVCRGCCASPTKRSTPFAGTLFWALSTTSWALAWPPPAGCIRWWPPSPWGQQSVRGDEFAAPGTFPLGRISSVASSPAVTPLSLEPRGPHRDRAAAGLRRGNSRHGPLPGHVRPVCLGDWRRIGRLVERPRQAAAYTAGRVFTYCVLGAVAGYCGARLEQHSSAACQYAGGVGDRGGSAARLSGAEGRRLAAAAVPTQRQHWRRILPGRRIPRPVSAAAGSEWRVSGGPLHRPYAVRSALRNAGPGHQHAQRRDSAD